MNPSLAAFYSIRVQATLDPTWEAWFEGMTISCNSRHENETRIEGSVRDQTALYSMLMKMRDLNLILIAVERQS